MNVIWCLFAFATIVGFSLILPVQILTNHGSYVLLSGLSALSVWLAYRASIGSWLQWLCSFLGDLSYALYLTHWIAYAIVLKLSKYFPVPKWAEFGAFVSIALLGAYLSFILFERPARNFIRQRVPARGVIVRVDFKPLVFVQK